MINKTNNVNKIMNHTTMKQFVAIPAAALILLCSCGDSKKDSNANLNDKKAALEKLKGEKDKLDSKITSLETDLAKIDTSAAAQQKAKLVAVQTLAASDFAHYIELQGRIDAENVSYVTPRGAPGQVKAIYVKQGQQVKKGQLLLKLDNAVVQQNVVAARQGLESIKTQLSYAKNIYQRQKNLWDQGIGTEVQLITAKNNVATLENQLQASEENVKAVQEQANTSLVYSDVNGIADQVTVKMGESFGSPGSGVIKIVNNSQLKVTGNIPENYLGSVSKGSPIIIQLPDANKTINANVSFVGASIDVINRGFVVEAKLPADPSLKPNQIALMKIKDYGASNTIVVPLNTLQNDEKGKFVMVATTENGKMIAHKRTVNIGQLNGDSLEVKTGLKAGDVLITEGFGSLYEGQLVTLK
ncbi:efflux RND transporter periplasmic adaptor subunit [Ferruginibacter paludis]|uniref:efflux RND transporter periplasmic adaptor subunit n=1 Tax=Ferruginibacter paludis TaxID=1310417 RepID=UPI0025B3E88C|nr:efflux RND transporter periplasmic adaptor subunit [Ferruginibacter paludis]MDN3659073.1 efflux RND transporter periplasmic adaptor subunit [Ferruginibacter paludis]